MRNPNTNTDKGPGIINEPSDAKKCEINTRTFRFKRGETVWFMHM